MLRYLPEYCILNILEHRKAWIKAKNLTAERRAEGERLGEVLSSSLQSLWLEKLSHDCTKTTTDLLGMFILSSNVVAVRTPRLMYYESCKR
ncbi:hypothetical protein DRN76_02435 [Methanosarcinales archaeon]|nr:MAG: hypothetical protein DRN76_02435 [Methanosarcinales archaeon]